MSLKIKMPGKAHQAIEILILLTLAVVPYLLSVGIDNDSFFFGGDSRLPELKYPG